MTDKEFEGEWGEFEAIMEHESGFVGEKIFYFEIRVDQSFKTKMKEKYGWSDEKVESFVRWFIRRGIAEKWLFKELESHIQDIQDMEYERFRKEIKELVGKVQEFIDNSCFKIAEKYNKPFEEALELYSEFESMEIFRRKEYLQIYKKEEVKRFE